MRMRRKKNLESRLERCDEYIIVKDSHGYSEYNRSEEVVTFLDFEKIFGNNNPVHLEIGCGKGQFAVEIAKRNPDINYIAVEKVSNVLVQACEKALNAELSNLIFMNCGAEFLDKYFKPESVGKIYLNFSCPYPKNRYRNRRLTSESFLNIYKTIMKKDAIIEQKTDNQKFFEFSIETFSKANFKLQNISLDLHNSDFEGNIVTEYEQKFLDMGMRIYRLEAYLGE